MEDHDKFQKGGASYGDDLNHSLEDFESEFRETSTTNPPVRKANNYALDSEKSYMGEKSMRSEK